MDFEKAKAYLSKQDKSGTSLYQHLAGIIKKVLEEEPDNVLDIFENLSLSVKASKLPNEISEIEQLYTNENERKEMINKVKDVLKLMGKKEEINKNDDNKTEEEKEAGNEENEEETEENIDLTKLPNILENKELFEWCGIKFNDDEIYLLQNSFKKLLKLNPLIISSRFWGKILGIKYDYYIVECKLSEYNEITPEETELKCEAPGFGLNEYIYYVCTIIEESNWIQLPNIKPNDIKMSKNIYRLFTGNLNENINGLNYYNGNESILLRSIIARISSSTIISPNNYWKKPDEENDENPFIIELNEEFINNENPIDYNNWVHSRPHLRLEGRAKKYIEPEKEDNEENNDEEKEPTPEESEEIIPILTSINTDKCNEYTINEESEQTNVWYLRNINKNIGYNIICLNNKLWNGSKTIYLNGTKKFVNIYIGNGLKYRNEYYNPTFPESIEEEFNEMEEIEVPNPENEEETIKQQVSIFKVQQEILPPPPEEKNEEEDPNKPEEK